MTHDIIMSPPHFILALAFDLFVGLCLGYAVGRKDAEK